MSTETDECAEGGRHFATTRRNDDGTTYEMCTECGELLSDDDAAPCCIAVVTSGGRDHIPGCHA